MPFGRTFAPGSPNQQSTGGPSGGTASPIQQAIQILSLRYPKVVGASAPVSSALLAGSGGTAQGGRPAPSAIVEHILRSVLGGTPGASPGGDPFGSRDPVNSVSSDRGGGIGGGVSQLPEPPQRYQGPTGPSASPPVQGGEQSLAQLIQQILGSGIGGNKGQAPPNITFGNGGQPEPPARYTPAPAPPGLGAPGTPGLPPLPGVGRRPLGA